MFTSFLHLEILSTHIAQFFNVIIQVDFLLCVVYLTLKQQREHFKIGNLEFVVLLDKHSMDTKVFKLWRF